MSGEFDGLDATEKAGFEAALNRCGRLALKLRANSVTRGPSISLTSWRWQTFVPSLSTFETGLRDLFGGADLWRHFNRLLRLLCSIHFFRSACTMARLWDRRHLHLDYDRRIGRGAAQLAALHRSRTRQLHLCR